MKTLEQFNKEIKIILIMQTVFAISMCLLVFYLIIFIHPLSGILMLIFFLPINRYLENKLIKLQKYKNSLLRFIDENEM